MRNLVRELETAKQSKAVSFMSLDEIQKDLGVIVTQYPQIKGFVDTIEPGKIEACYWEVLDMLTVLTTQGLKEYITFNACVNKLLESSFDLQECYVRTLDGDCSMKEYAVIMHAYHDKMDVLQKVLKESYKGYKEYCKLCRIPYIIYTDDETEFINTLNKEIDKYVR